MKIGAYYSHLNGLEWLLHHHKGYWFGLRRAIANVDAASCRTKVSAEKTMTGKMLYGPKPMNKAFEVELRKRGWGNAQRNDYYVTKDPEFTKQIIDLPKEQQKAIIESAGESALSTHNSADFRKGRVSVEVQFGKYAFVQFDLFVKHAADYMRDRIDLGIEIVPMKALEREMSSGPSFYEKNLNEILRQGRIFPPVPLILIGVEP